MGFGVWGLGFGLRDGFRLGLVAVVEMVEEICWRWVECRLRLERDKAMLFKKSLTSSVEAA